MEELKSRGIAETSATLDLQDAVLAATAIMRDRFREIIGSEPIAVQIATNMYAIRTYDAGEYLTAGQFCIAPMHGCCGMVVFFYASVTKDFQRKGFEQLFLQVRETAAKLAGYTIAQATVLETNKPERQLLLCAGWNEMKIFRNKRTGNNVVVCLKEL